MCLSRNKNFWPRDVGLSRCPSQSLYFVLTFTRSCVPSNMLEWAENSNISGWPAWCLHDALTLWPGNGQQTFAYLKTHIMGSPRLWAVFADCSCRWEGLVLPVLSEDWWWQSYDRLRWLRWMVPLVSSDLYFGFGFSRGIVQRWSTGLAITRTWV